VRTAILILLIMAFSDVAQSQVRGVEEVLVLRKQYNVVSARIDSVVRAMRRRDVGALETEKLPDGRDALSLPENTEVVAIFWADDEAKVWINDHFIGETRLTPVEIIVPSLYLKSNNIIRAKGWDTDFVESGFLFGLYIRREDALYPIVVSDDAWVGVNGGVETITYAHTFPDIPKAEVIWGDRTFGMIEMMARFGAAQVEQASLAVEQSTFANGEHQEMSLHAFVAELAVLETERERLKAELRRRASALSVPGYTGSGGMTSLTLGKAGPLKEGITKPVSEQIKGWSEQLTPERKALVIPSWRTLRGEGASTAVGEAATGAAGSGDRREDYVPPSDRRNEQPGTEDGQPGAAGGGGGGTGEATGLGGSAGGFGGRASRLGLLLPALVLATYALYATREWRRISRETNQAT
jgi:hypothetical protein